MICRLTICWVLLACLIGCQHGSSAEETYHKAYENFLQGNLQAADQQAEQAASRWSVTSSPGWHWKFLLLRARVMLLRGRQDCVPSLLRGSPPDPPLEVRRKGILANALIKLGRYHQAEAALEEAIKQALDLSLTSLLPDLEVRKGLLYSKRSQGGLAESTLRRALDLSRQYNDQFSEADALNQLGMMRMAGAKPDKAIPYFEQALAVSALIGAAYIGEIFEDNLAICYGLIGEFEKAIVIRNKAIAFFKKADANSALQQALGETGNLYLDKGEPEKSISFFKQAYDLAVSIHRPSDACIWSGNLALAYIELGRWDDAETYNSKAGELQIQLKETEPLEYLQLNAALIEAGKGRTEQAEALYRDLVSSSGRNPDVLLQARAGYGSLEASRAHWPEARSHFEGAIQVIERTRADLLFGEHRITFLARLIRFYRQYVELLVQQGDFDRALYVADSIRALALIEGIEPAGTPTAAAVTVTPDYRETVRKWGGVVLSYWIAPRESYLWAISPKEVRFVKLPPAKDVAALVDAYRASIEKQISDPLQSGSATGHKLHAMLVQPVADMLPPGSRVILVADGPLHNLNFETLLTPGTPSHYWIEDAVISVAPSLRVLASGPPLSNTASARTLLLIGDPQGHEPDAPKLQYAKDELAAIQAQFTPAEYSVFADRQATPEIYRRMVANGFSMVHFSAHAIANPISPLDSAILLSPSGNDYKLYARDIMSLSLNANLVTLSACRSAGARAYAGEGLVGFSWAFLHAGAHNVIAGLWDVSDRSTAEFMGKFYAQLGLGKEPAEALRATKLGFLNSEKGFRKPYYWAPFQIYTTGRAPAR
jgi:CHAT domain-containing protein/tetratricopeptide (TPR) repeat protein